MFYYKKISQILIKLRIKRHSDWDFQKERHMHKNKSLLLSFLLLSFLFLAIAVQTNTSTLLTIDYYCNKMFYGGAFPYFTPFVVAFSHLGDTIFELAITLVASLILHFKFNKFELARWFFLTNMLGLGLIQFTIKYLLQRPRPDMLPHLTIAGSYSFPSGHALGSILFYGSLSLLLFILWPDSSFTRSLPYFTCLLACLLGLSRLYLGVHYLSDVLAGYCLGASCLIVSLYYLPKAKRASAP